MRVLIVVPITLQKRSHLLEAKRAKFNETSTLGTSEGNPGHASAPYNVIF